jgi:hypothetical protein
VNPQRLVLSGTLAVMPRRKYPREGLWALLLVLLIIAIGWGALLWPNHL